MINAPTKCARSAVNPLTADALASSDGDTVPHPAYIPGNGPSARAHQFPNVFRLKMKFSAPKIQFQKIKPNIGEYSDFETPGGPPLLNPPSAPASHSNPLSRNAFLNSPFKITHSKLPHFCPKNMQFFATWSVEPACPQKCHEGWAARSGPVQTDGNQFKRACGPAQAPSSAVKRGQARSSAVKGLYD